MQNNQSSDEMTPVPYKINMPPSPVRDGHEGAGSPSGALSPYRDEYALHMPSEAPTPMRMPVAPGQAEPRPPAPPLAPMPEENGVDAETLALARQLQEEDERYFAEQQEGATRLARLEAERRAQQPTTPRGDGVDADDAGGDEQDVDEDEGSMEDDDEDDEEIDESLALAWRLQREEDDRALLLALNGGVEPPAGVNLRNVSPSQMSFDQLTELGNNIGTVSKGASVSAIESLPTVTFDQVSSSSAIVGEQCAICRLEFEADDVLRILPCRHADHADCVDKWLVMNRSCPHCLKEVAARFDSKTTNFPPAAANDTARPAAPSADDQQDPNSITQDDCDDIGALLDL